MNVLFVTYDFPYPTNSGGKMRAYNLMKQKDNDISLYLFSFVRDGFDEGHIDQVKKIGVKDVKVVKRRKKDSTINLSSVFHPEHSVFHKLYFDEKTMRDMHDYVKTHKITLIHFESYYTAFYLSETFRNAGVTQVFGTENIEANVYDDFILHRVRLLLRPFYRMQNKKIRLEEEKMFGMADASLAVTQAEKEYINKFTDKPVHVIPNGVDLSRFPFKPLRNPDNRTLLFIGNFSYHPNVDAADFLHREVLPILPQGYTLRIIGKGSSDLPIASDKRVYAENFVDDILDEYTGAGVFVSPVRIGGGTNFKILESMAVGLPIVTFPDRTHDLRARDGEHVLFAASGREFVTAIEKLVLDQALRKNLVENARKLIEEQYSWQVIGKKMNEVWKNTR